MTARTVLRRRLVAKTTSCPAGRAAYDAGTRSVLLTYRKRDPFAVQLEVPSGATFVVWLLSRDLLADGLNGPAGLGDVAVNPDVFDPDTYVWVCLFDPAGSGSVQLGFHRADLERALDEMDAIVPAGTEPDLIDWDREWRLLAGDR